MPEVKDAAGRAIAYKVLDPADMLDLLEAAGGNSTNQGYMRMAMVVSSVTEIDGTPVPAPRTREHIRNIAKQLGNDGLVALNEAMFGDSQTTEDTQTAKN